MTEAVTRELMAQRFRSFLPVVVDLETGGFNAQRRDTRDRRGHPDHGSRRQPDA